MLLRLALALFLAAGALGERAALQRAALAAGFDPYAVLRAPRGASRDEVKAAYRRALNALGRAASRGGHGQVTRDADFLLMQDVRQAYEVLSDAAWRAEWDAAHPARADEGAAAATAVPKWKLDEDEDDL
jgi:DnaJ-class molecular chaperone